MKIKNHRLQAFTLIELLAVIAIIGVLAGMLIPGIQMALKAAHRTRDMNAAKNIVTILIADAMDHGGKFRTGIDSETPASTSLEVFQGLLDSGMMDDPNAFAAEGTEPADSLVLKEENVGFQYVTGLKTTSLSRMPIIFTKGVGLTPDNMEGKSFDPGTSAWETDGFAVAFVAGNATFIRNDKQGSDSIETAAPLVLGKIPAGVEVLP